jgi:hypothetical protein
MGSTTSISFVKWTLIGAVAGVALVGVNSAIGQAKAAATARPAVDGWRVQVKSAPADGEAFNYKLQVENTQAQPRSADLVVKLVRREFKGNPMSRVLRADDYVVKELGEKRMSLQLGANQSKELVVSFAAKPDTGASPSSGVPRLSYSLDVQIGGKAVRVVALRDAPR